MKRGARDFEVRDPGLQPERTILAWRRTLISLLVVDLFIWRSWLLSGPGIAGDSPAPIDYLGVCALMAAAATAAVSGAVWIRSRQLRSGTPAASARLMVCGAGAVVALGCTAVAAIALGG